METRTRGTPRTVGTGPEEKPEDTTEKPSGSEDPGGTRERPEKSLSSSSTAKDKGDGVCLACALGTKGSHTYQKECARYVAGATLAQMQRAARGGRKGHHRLLMELALQRQDAEQERAERSARPLDRGSSQHRAAQAVRQLPHRVPYRGKHR